MAIGKDKTRILITIPISIKEELESLADLDDRTLSNYCSKILKNHVQENSSSTPKLLHMKKIKDED